MIDIKQYLEQTNTVLLTKDAFEYLKERASVPDKVKAEYDPSADLISREKTLTAFADYVGSGMSMDDYDALWDIVAKMPAVKQEPRFIAKSDGTIEQIKECTEQEPCDKCVYSTKDGDCQYDDVTETIPPFEPCGDAIDRAEAIRIASGYCHPTNVAKELAKLPSVNPQPCEDAISRQAVLDMATTIQTDDYSGNEIIEVVDVDDVKALPPVTPQPKTEQFAKWVATEIFDDMWEYNKDAFDELACRKLAKLGIVVRMGDEWELVESQERSGKE